MNTRRVETDLELPGGDYVKTIFREPGCEQVVVINRHLGQPKGYTPWIYTRQHPHQHWRKAKPKS